MANIVLVVNVKTKPGCAETLIPAMQENAAKSVLEDGCFQFDISTSEDDENEFIFYEVYKNKDALASHRKTQHFLAYFNLMQDLGDNVSRNAQLYEQMS
ncbi:MAG: antibiotic biosynthesis monooxygenase [Proteobacteria bacterium]|jgi:(4S)-4-hydroxy-5-phosphonooxypentane-2,3-dione isomerase|nr:antibiotic biosynthesis monooxygenase [Pseudomonadota bacterium]